MSKKLKDMTVEELELEMKIKEINLQPWQLDAQKDIVAEMIRRLKTKPTN